jgi:hypothetical protein
MRRTSGGDHDHHRRAARRADLLLDGVGAHMSFERRVADFPIDAINALPSNVDYTPWHLLEHMRITRRTSSTTS